MSGKLEEFVRSATHMPALPTMVEKLLLALNKPSVSVDELSKIVSTDTVFSAKVLKMANSVFYFRAEPAATLKIATVRLGHKTIRSLAVTVWTQTFKTFPLKKTEQDLIAELLQHGTAAAVGASLLVQQVQGSLAEDAYMAGLLHDIGRLALICQLGGRYQAEVLNRAIAEQQAIQDVEQDVLGFEHAMLGAHLLQSWHISDVAVQAAARHHRAAIYPEKEPLVAAVALADDLASRKGFNLAQNTPRLKRDAFMEFFRITDLPAFEEQWKSKLQSLTQSMENL